MEMDSDIGDLGVISIGIGDYVAMVIGAFTNNGDLAAMAKQINFGDFTAMERDSEYGDLVVMAMDVDNGDLAVVATLFNIGD